MKTEGGGDTRAMQRLPDELFGRVDDSDDALFYQLPRLVAHIDPGTIAALTRYYGEVLPTARACWT